ncbi:MAG: hypothetical protein MZV63_49220 [Marinilabiliales bacterium]|nr:hypothetical protein [Marinilabiliales bacterium]
MSLIQKAYKRDYIKPPDIKSGRDLGLFDCISAPCRDTCATSQDVPDYLLASPRRASLTKHLKSS